jgi:hypothetical protein
MALNAAPDPWKHGTAPTRPSQDQQILPAMFLMPMSKSAAQTRPLEYFMLQEPQGEGPVVGYFAGQTISEHMTDYLGQRYRFAGLAPLRRDGRYDVDALRPGEWLVEPGLIYVSEPSGRPRRGGSE